MRKEGTWMLGRPSYYLPQLALTHCPQLLFLYNLLFSCITVVLGLEEL
jgi:hypothetical protein